MACDILQPCKSPSPDSCQKSFLWTDEEVDLAPHPDVGLVLQVGDAEKFSKALGFDSLDLFSPFFLVSKHGPCFTDTEDGGDKSLVQHELACEADSVDPV